MLDEARLSAAKSANSTAIWLMLSSSYRKRLAEDVSCSKI